jgi:hypothetical protein
MSAREGRSTLLSCTSFWLLTGVLAVVGLVFLGGAVIAAQGRLIGGDDGSDCTSNPAAAGAPSGEGIGVSVTPSYWPLGTVCSFSGSSGQRVTVPETDWTLTVIALTGVAFAVSPTALLPFTRLRVWWSSAR